MPFHSDIPGWPKMQAGRLHAMWRTGKERVEVAMSSSQRMWNERGYGGLTEGQRFALHATEAAPREGNSGELAVIH